MYQFFLRGLIFWGCILLLPPQYALSEEESITPLSLSIGSVRTVAEASAVRIAIDYTENLPETFFIAHAVQPQQSGSLLDITPSIILQTGENDTFNAIITKLSGNFIFFSKTVTVDNIPTPPGTLHVFPVSLGFETSRSFKTMNFLTEIGYVPFVLRQNSMLKLGINPRAGLFLQAGYKSKIDENPVEEGGAKDESAEDVDNGVFRLKAHGELDLPLLYLSKNGKSISLLSKATGWYDISNSDVYHKLDVILRLSLFKNKHFDLAYENGSGAPNFNTGEQFSANITVQF